MVKERIVEVEMGADLLRDAVVREAPMECGHCGWPSPVLFRRLETGDKRLCSECNEFQAKADGYAKGDKPGHPSGKAVPL